MHSTYEPIRSAALIDSKNVDVFLQSFPLIKGKHRSSFPHLCSIGSLPYEDTQILKFCSTARLKKTERKGEQVLHGKTMWFER